MSEKFSQYQSDLETIELGKENLNNLAEIIFHTDHAAKNFRHSYDDSEFKNLIDDVLEFKNTFQEYYSLEDPHLSQEDKASLLARYYATVIPLNTIKNYLIPHGKTNNLNEIFRHQDIFNQYSSKNPHTNIVDYLVMGHHGDVVLDIQKEFPIIKQEVAAQIDVTKQRIKKDLDSINNKAQQNIQKLKQMRQ